MAQLSVQELRDLVGSENEAFSNRVLHSATSLRGTRPYWFKQRSRLFAMVDTLGLPTVFFTHSATDTQWPELANLICTNNPSSKSERSSLKSSNSRLVFLSKNQAVFQAFLQGHSSCKRLLASF